MSAPTSLRKRIIALYRTFHRTAREKVLNDESPMQRRHLRPLMKSVRAEFEQYRTVPRTNFERIDFLFRKGEKQLAVLQNTRVSSFAGVDFTA
ncbi:MAG: hypothetical protein MHM6MM_003358 [Cercozoa sp. M6MM]